MTRKGIKGIRMKKRISTHNALDALRLGGSFRIIMIFFVHNFHSFFYQNIEFV